MIRNVIKSTFCGHFASMGLLNSKCQYFRETLIKNVMYIGRNIFEILTNRRLCYSTTPSKLVVYKPMGAERVADRTIAQSCSYVPFHSSA